MSKKTFQLVSDILRGSQIIAIALVAYLVKDDSIRASVVAAIPIGVEAVIKICEKFIKD